jgi:glycosyltransferase involved in cell wall biosynthesis
VFNTEKKMESRPLVSVIIPAYNVERYIYRCLNSILNQNVQDLEILVYDDGSLDNTYVEICKFSHERLKVFRGEVNRGVVFARNFLLNQASGEFIAFQDADDWSHRDRFRMQAEYLRLRPRLAACGTQFIKVVGKDFVYRSEFPTDRSSIRRDIPNAFHFLPGSIMLRRSVVDAVGCYSPFFGNDGNEDLYWVSKIAISGGLENVNAHLYYYNLNLASLTKLGSFSTRKLYIPHINAHLLRDLIDKGTNWLESGNVDKLNSLEAAFGQLYQTSSKFDVFENTIGQLLFYKQHNLAIKEIIRYGFHTREFMNMTRLLLYVLRDFFSHED